MRVVYAERGASKSLNFLVSPAGFEPRIQPEHSGDSQGQNRRKPGQNQGLGLEAGAGRESAGEGLERAGIHNQSITGAQPKTDFPPDLRALVDAWPKLSEQARREIALIVETERKAR